MLYRVLLFPLQILRSPEMGGQDELFVDLCRYHPDLAQDGLGRARKRALARAHHRSRNLSGRLEGPIAKLKRPLNKGDRGSTIATPALGKRTVLKYRIW